MTQLDAGAFDIISPCCTIHSGPVITSRFQIGCTKVLTMFEAQKKRNKRDEIRKEQQEGFAMRKISLRARLLR